MAPTIIRSTDAAAVSASAILTGNAGSLVAVLDYALVTVLGWGKAFSGTNAAAYRAPAGVRHYLDVNDNAPDGTALGRNARVRGYETMTAVATGTGPFPTTTQVTTCVGLIKSTATGTTARPWLIIGDDRTFYMFSEAAGTDPPTLSTHTWTDAFFFGEIYSALTGDGYRTILAFASTTSTAVTASSAALNTLTNAGSATAANYAMPRSYLGTGGSEWAVPAGNNFYNGGTVYSGFSNLVFPNSIDGGVYLHANNVLGRGSGTTAAAPSYIRGRLRGMYGTAHFLNAMNDQDTFSGVGDFTGKTFIALQVAGTKGQAVVFETTAWTASS